MKDTYIQLKMKLRRQYNVQNGVVETSHKILTTALSEYPRKVTVKGKRGDSSSADCSYWDPILE